ncbi:hypothetical protein WBN73_19745 [Paenarthrobacter sp. CCNWLY172]|uniref:hypothetical protein n=1 Tax=Micrococcaceae TaxID=1268 RepID=UPI001A998C25|nr:hypothetical protein [Arthrobacter sp. D5-1]QSZ47878.1 hypothetical protein AYX22_05310 [Arthrobacter sp. D5-1]
MSHETWSAVLDGFERDIALAVSGGAVPQWAPPVNAGPLPASLAERARRVLDAQSEAVAILNRVKHDAGTQLGAIDAVPSGAGSDRPLLLDVRG